MNALVALLALLPIHRPPAPPVDCRACPALVDVQDLHALCIAAPWTSAECVDENPVEACMALLSTCPRATVTTCDYVACAGALSTTSCGAKTPDVCTHLFDACDL